VPPDPALTRALDEARLARLRAQVPRAIEQSREGLGRVGRIVSAMKNFCHPSNGSRSWWG
jgi:hypothetical protein